MCSCCICLKHESNVSIINVSVRNPSVPSNPPLFQWEAKVIFNLLRKVHHGTSVFYGIELKWYTPENEHGT